MRKFQHIEEGKIGPGGESKVIPRAADAQDSGDSVRSKLETRQRKRSSSSVKQVLETFGPRTDLMQLIKQ